MRQETPEPWASAMVAAGLDDRGRPSIRALARKAQEATGTVRPSVETVRRLVHGMGVAEPETVDAVAKALRVDVRHVTGWAGGIRTVAKPYQPPAEADLLTARQRKAVDEIIRAMADREGQADGTPTRTNSGADLEIHDPNGNVTMVELKSGTKSSAAVTQVATQYWAFITFLAEDSQDKAVQVVRDSVKALDESERRELLNAMPSEMPDTVAELLRAAGDEGRSALTSVSGGRRRKASQPKPPTLEDIHEGRAAAHKTRGKKDRQS